MNKSGQSFPIGAGLVAGEETLYVCGYALRWSGSANIAGLTESFAPRSFQLAIAAGLTEAMIDHGGTDAGSFGIFGRGDPVRNEVIARMSDGTLALKEDAEGLVVHRISNDG